MERTPEIRQMTAQGEFRINCNHIVAELVFQYVKAPVKEPNRAFSERRESEN